MERPGIYWRRQVHLDWAPYRSYTRENVRLYAPLEGGVYKLAYRNTNGTLTVFYVGQGKNLDKRLTDHLSAAEPNPYMRDNLRAYPCYFTYAKVRSAFDRDGCERALYLHYRTECNDPDAIPSRPDLEVNPR